MTVAIGDVGRKGRLDLRFASRNGRTVLADSYNEVPFKITRLFDSRDSSPAHMILMQCTAGIFGGDTLDCTIHVESGARVRLTQQSATKVHPSGARLAHQAMRIRVEPGAELIFDAEAVIPFAESRFCQKTWIDAAPGSRFAYWESFMAGRIGSDERWKFHELTLETRLNVDGRLLFMDRFGVFPGRQALNSEWIAGNATYLSTGLYFGTDAAEVAARLHRALPEAGVDSPATNLAVTRAVSASGPDFHRNRALFAEQVWGDQTLRCARTN